MPAPRRIMQALAAIVLLLSLGVASVTDALTHGPGTLLAKAEHAAFHADRGEHWAATGHPHHDASDHDHATPAILAAEDETLPDRFRPGHRCFGRQDFRLHPEETEQVIEIERLRRGGGD